MIGRKDKIKLLRPEPWPDPPVEENEGLLGSDVNDIQVIESEEDNDDTET